MSDTKPMFQVEITREEFLALPMVARDRILEKQAERLIALTPPTPGELRKCLICALEKPWGVFDSATGASVCCDCRDKARRDDSAPPSDELTKLRHICAALRAALEDSNNLLQSIPLPENDEGQVGAQISDNNDVLAWRGESESPNVIEEPTPRTFAREDVKPLVEALTVISRGDYDNAHDCKAASKVASDALEHAKERGLL